MSNSSRAAAAVMTLSLLIVFIASSLCFAQDNKVPRFHLQKKSVELGEFVEGQDVEYTFTVRNTGTAELQIVNVRPG